MAQTIIDSDTFVRGNLTCNSMTIPAGTLTNAMVNANAAIAASKVVHRFPISYSQIGGTDVTAATVPIHIVSGQTATIESLSIMPLAAPSGGNKQITVDLKKSTGGGAYTSVLSGGTAYAITTSATSLAVYTATVATTALVVGDTLELVVTPSGSTGTQCQGLVCTVRLSEDPA